MPQSRKEIAKRYRDKNRARLRERWRAEAKTYRETVAADPKHREKRKAYVKTYRKNNPERRMLADAKARAAKGGFPCTVELKDIFIPSLCPLLLRPFERKGPYAPSLDKIIPSLGYVPGNIMVVSRRANSIKHDATAEEIRLLAANLSLLLAMRGQ